MDSKEINKAALMLISAANRLDLQQATKVTREQLSELLSYLKALRECYQALHWTSRGEPYYGDHTLFERLYKELLEDIDSLAEKAIGITDDAYVVDLQYQAARVSTHINEIMSHLPDMTTLQCVLRAETRMCKEIVPKVLNSLEQARELSDGLENFLQGLVDKHEQSIYHLQRRLKTQKELTDMEHVEPNISPPPAPQPDVEQQFNQEVSTVENPPV